jgi:dethiobiotin synthetase
VKRVFVTGSGTGVGKTLVTAALTHQLRAAGRSVCALKPVISGYTPTTHRDSDTAVLLDSLGLAHTQVAIDRLSPFRFEAPLSPDMAAAREGRGIDFDALLGLCRDAAAGPDDVLLIEGVGGVMVPLTEDKTVLDWITALEMPCLLVVGSYLGTISHTLTAVEALRGRNARLIGIVISESAESPAAPAETRATIRRFLPDTRIVVLPRLGGGAPWRNAPDLTALLDDV